MSKYLLIESRDSFDSRDSSYFAELVEELAAKGNQAILFLVQNGVFPARKGSKYGETVAGLIKNKVKVLADGFSLKERGIKNMVDGVETADMDRLVDLLLEPGAKVIWH